MITFHIAEQEHQSIESGYHRHVDVLHRSTVVGRRNVSDNRGDWIQIQPYLVAFVDIENVVLVIMLRIAMISPIVLYPGGIVTFSSLVFMTALIVEST